MHAKAFKHFDQTDDFKIPETAPHGGFEIKDKELLTRLRSAGKELLKQVGRKLMSGNLNLT